jgi:hypothetical protein
MVATRVVPTELRMEPRTAEPTVYWKAGRRAWPTAEPRVYSTGVQTATAWRTVCSKVSTTGGMTVEPTVCSKDGVMAGQTVSRKAEKKVSWMAARTMLVGSTDLRKVYLKVGQKAWQMGSSMALLLGPKLVLVLA